MTAPQPAAASVRAEPVLPVPGPPGVDVILDPPAGSAGVGEAPTEANAAPPRPADKMQAEAADSPAPLPETVSARQDAGAERPGPTTVSNDGIAARHAQQSGEGASSPIVSPEVTRAAADQASQGPLGSAAPTVPRRPATVVRPERATAASDEGARDAQATIGSDQAMAAGPHQRPSLARPSADGPAPTSPRPRVELRRRQPGAPASALSPAESARSPAQSARPPTRGFIRRITDSMARALRNPTTSLTRSSEVEGSVISPSVLPAPGRESASRQTGSVSVDTPTAVIGRLGDRRVATVAEQPKGSMPIVAAAAGADAGR